MGVQRNPSQTGLKKRTISATASGIKLEPATQATKNVVCLLDAGSLMGLFPSERPLQGTEPLFEDGRSKALLTAPLRCFASARRPATHGAYSENRAAEFARKLAIPAVYRRRLAGKRSIAILLAADTFFSN